MACGDHNTTVKILCTYCIGNTWGRRYMKKIYICTGRCQTCNKCIFKHITASSCIFSNNNLSFMVSSIIPAYVAPHLKCMIYCQFNICFSTKSICSKIFSHNCSPLLFTISSVSALHTVFPGSHPKLLLIRSDMSPAKAADICLTY